MFRVRSNKVSKRPCVMGEGNKIIQWINEDGLIAIGRFGASGLPKTNKQLFIMLE